MPQNYSEFSFDQTQFSLEEPLHENLAQLPQEEKPVEDKPKVPLLKRKKVVAGIIAGIIFFVIILLVIVNAIIARSRRPIAPDITPLPTGAGGPTHPIEAKIDTLEDQLKAYDESQSNLVMPAVDFEISIDEVKRQ